MIETQKIPEAEFSAKSLEKTDAALVHLCRAGDETAWNELVDRYQRLIFTIPRRAGLSEEQAADVFQEVFLKDKDQAPADHTYFRSCIFYCL